jgi:hypothetical protein
MSATIEEFRAELNNDVDLAAGSKGGYREDAFFQIACEHLEAAGEIEAFERTPFADRGMRIDGHGGSPDEADQILSLIVLDFDQSEALSSLTGSELGQIFNRVTGFWRKAKDPAFRAGLEESSPAFEAANHVNNAWDKAARVKLILISNRRLSARVDGRDTIVIDEKPISYSVWDLDRLWRFVASGREREDMELNFEKDFGGAIPALPAHLGFGSYEAFLCILSGAQLASVYDRWGSRLLEQNVRSFLQLKGNVNKGIATTIKDTPELFFAYNNGITATAEKVEFSADGQKITSISNLQIVNGGQTTASLNLQRSKGVSLDAVFVQMKLSLVKHELAEEIVPKISEYANTQNKVNAADFFANHPFHVELEKLSRQILAPAAEGSFSQTKWFYERSRGQFLNERSRLTPASQKRFDAEWPKKQLITKTDIAKYLNLWPSSFGKINPLSVCKGAQKNFSEFAQGVSRKWTDNSVAEINDVFFRECVAKAIVFKETERLVSERPWYQGGYRAQIVAHAIAKLAWDINEEEGSLNFEKIWMAQALTGGIRQSLQVAADAVMEVVTTPALAGQNITEWAKQSACWTRVQELKVDWPEALQRDLQSGFETKERKLAARKDKIELTGLEAKIKITRLGPQLWSELQYWASSNKKLSGEEISVINLATKPNLSMFDSQCLLALNALEKAKRAGFKPSKA